MAPLQWIFRQNITRGGHQVPPRAQESDRRRHPGDRSFRQHPGDFCKDF